MRRTAIIRMAAAATLSIATLGVAETARAETRACNAMFVHHANEIRLEADKLTLKGFNPTIVFFCDRPERFAGHLTVGDFVNSFTKGIDSFAADPPNAVVSIQSEGGFHDVVVTLNKQPIVNGDEFVYHGIQIIEGDLPKITGAGTMFIDPVGRPMSPGSVAGVHRRHTRRTISRCAAGVTCY